jgi:membrane protease YdiL (CAAX protease family)
MSAYEPHDILAKQAFPHSGLLRLFSGVVLLFIGTVALQVALVRMMERAGMGALLRDSISGATAEGTLVALYTFVIPFMVLWVVLRGLHNRAISGVLGPISFAVRDFFRVMIALVVFAAIVLIVPVPEAMRPSSQLPFSTWLMWLPLALMGILLQVSCEEFIFRGYLQSQLAARFTNPAIWIFLPSFIFGLVHYAPSIYGENAIFIAAWAFLFGLAAADITARSGSLGPAIAMHFGNNIIGILIVGTPGHLSGLALTVLPFGPDNIALVRQSMIVELPALLCLWLAARLAIRR